MLADEGNVEQGLGHLCIISSNFHSCHKTDLEQYLFKHNCIKKY